MRTPRHLGGAQSGGVIFLLVIGVLVLCATLASALFVSSEARHREAVELERRERAFQYAEAGVDWAVAELRKRNGELPDPATETHAVDTMGDFVVDYQAGESNGIDDDGDGTIDNAEEADFRRVVSTGRANGTRRRIEVVLRVALNVPEVSASVQLNVDVPIVDFRGNAFMINGHDHALDGTLDPLAVSKAGVGSPAPIADLESQIAAARQDQVVGLGGTPSLDQVARIDLDTLVMQASAAATILLPGGTVSQASLGTPTLSGVEVAYCPTDLHLSGGSGGAGILVVDGDLEISGGFEWTGLVLVRGRVRFVGGGAGKRVIGATIVGEELGEGTSTTGVGVTGTVDLLYSSAAIRLAQQGLSILAVAGWREVGLQ